MTAGAHTVTYKAQTTYAALAAAGFVLTARYLNGSGVLVETSAQQAIITRASAADWTQAIAVTFTVGTAGWVDLRLELIQYESGKVVYVWPTPAVTGINFVPQATWSMGDSVIMKDAFGGGYSKGRVVNAS